MHVALLANGIGPGDEVITTSFTFIASTNAILYVGAEPVFADIDPSTFNIDVEQIERLITPRTRAIMPVDLYGQAAKLVEIERICERHDLVLIDDASQAPGAGIDKRRNGTFGTATFSFYPDKNMTTAEGGMITTNDAAVADAGAPNRISGSTRTYYHERLGFNFRMTNIQAAIGLEQLHHFPAFNERRIENAAYFSSHIRGAITPVTSPGNRHVFHQYTLRIVNNREALADALRNRGIENRVYYPLPVHQQVSYRALGKPDIHLPETERAAAQVLSIPVHPSITDAQREYIAKTVTELCLG